MPLSLLSTSAGGPVVTHEGHGLTFALAFAFALGVGVFSRDDAAAAFCFINFACALRFLVTRSASLFSRCGPCGQVAGSLSHWPSWYALQNLGLSTKAFSRRFSAANAVS